MSFKFRRDHPSELEATLQKRFFLKLSLWIFLPQLISCASSPFADNEKIRPSQSLGDLPFEESHLELNKISAPENHEASVSQMQNSPSSSPAHFSDGNNKNFQAQIKDANPSEQGKKAPDSSILATITKTLSLDNRGELEQEALQKARMVARLNDLENQVSEHSQKIRVLEKAIKLGIIPEELKSKHPKSSQLLSEYAGDDEIFDDLEVVNKDSTKNDAKSTELRRAGFRKDLAEANSLYSKAEYGKAFIAYQKMDQKYSDAEKNGEPLFWMGRCWLALKEYQTARQYFKDMIRANPSSSKVAQSKVFMAQSELKMGLNQEALTNLRDVIREFPDGNASDEAKKMLSNMKDQL